MNKIDTREFAFQTHVLLRNTKSTEKQEIGIAYTWDNGDVVIKATTEIKCGDTINLVPLNK